MTEDELMEIFNDFLTVHFNEDGTSKKVIERHYLKQIIREILALSNKGDINAKAKVY